MVFSLRSQKLRLAFILTICLVDLAASVAAKADVGEITQIILNTDITGDGYALSGDGTTLVGENSSFHAFRWISASGMSDLGTFGGTTSAAYGVSRDGSVVVGQADLSPGVYHAFRWTASGGMVDLGTFGGIISSAYGGVSADGNVVVGEADLAGDTTTHAFRWTASGGMVDLGTLGGNNSYSFGVSADGNVVVGQANIAGTGYNHAFRWTASDGMVDLGTLGGSISSAWKTSDDGSVVVGRSNITGDTAYHAYRWASSSGLVDLGTLGGTNSEAWAVSGNGSVIVGDAQDASNTTRAFRWTSATGMTDLNALLVNAGVNMTGIDLVSARSISSDGRIMAANDSNTTYLVSYLDAVTGGIGGITTAAAQQQATQNVAAQQTATLMSSRATANQMLGATRPMINGNYSYSGALVGSAVGYLGAQHTVTGTELTLLGGLAYGAQDYPGIKQSDALTVASAVRYLFQDPFGDAEHALRPFTEIGGWATPHEMLTIDRSYANGAGVAKGEGNTNAISWGEYARTGLVWQVDSENSLSAYGEVGQQSLAFDAYGEAFSAANPFPATVADGVTRYGTVRVGGSYTRDLKPLIYAPWSLTLSGAVARSFDVHSGLNVSVVGVGMMTASQDPITWGEFGGQIDMHLTKQMTVDIGLSGTSAPQPLGTVLHGICGLSYKF